MDIQFTMSLTKESWIQFNKIYGNFINRKKRLFLLFLIFIVASAEVISLVSLYNYIMLYRPFFKLHGYSQIFNYDSSKIMIPIIYLFLFVLLMYKYSFSIQIAAKKMLDHPENKGLLEEKRIQIDEQNISILTDSSESVFSWDNVVKIVETQDFIAILINSYSCLLLEKEKMDSQQKGATEKLLDNYNGNIIDIKKYRW